LLEGKAEEKCITRCVPEEILDAYQTDTPTKHATTREGIQDIDSPLEPHHEISIVSSKVAKNLSLLLKDVDDGVGRFATCELVDNLMLDQVGPCSLLEFIQGSFKK
jgi:hypothetical protein